MRLEIVTHCWRYSRLLTYQLSSLALFPLENTQVTMTVFYSHEDEDTVKVLDFFSSIEVNNVTWRWWPLETRSLMQRAIGRNLAALNNQADWIWFADADLCFRENSLDRLTELVAAFSPAQLPPLIYPQYLWSNRDSATGDAHIGRLDGSTRLVDLNPADFIKAKWSRATGAVQISPGALVKETGYCLGSRFQKPAGRWMRTFADVAFRRQLGSSGKAVDVPHVYRISHSQAGRKHPAIRL